MKQQTKRKFSLIIDSIIAFVLAFFFIFGAVTTVNNAFTTASASESTTVDYSTWERSEITGGLNVFNKYLLFENKDLNNDGYKDNLGFEFYIDNIQCEFGEVVKGGISGQNNKVSIFIYLDVTLYAELDITYETITLDGVEYYLFNISEPYVDFVYTDFPGNYNGYEEFKVDLTKVALNYPSTVTTLIEPKIEPNKPTNVPTNKPTEDEEKTGCGSFFEDVGTVVNEVLKIDAEPFATGIFTFAIGAVLLGIFFVAIKK